MGFVPNGISFFITDVSSGGIVARLQKWIEELALRGYPVEVHAFHDRSSIFTPKITGKTFPEATFYLHRYDSLDKSSVVLREIVGRESFDRTNVIVSSTFVRAGPLVNALRLSGWQGRYVEVVPTDMDGVVSSCESNLFECDIIGAVSSQVASKLSARWPEKPAVVVPGGAKIHELATGRKHPRASDEPLRVCFAGRMDSVSKRIFDLPLIAEELEATGTICQWLIAGAGRDLEELKQRFGKFPLTHLPTFFGKLPISDLRTLLTTSHVFILPSAYEGMSNSLCEAGEAGAVPVVSKVSGSSDVIETGLSGFIVDVGDTAGFVAAIRELAENEQLWIQMSCRIRERVARDFSVSASIDRLTKALDDLPGDTPLVAASHQAGHAARRGARRRLLDSPGVPNWLVRMIRRFWRQWVEKLHGIV
jgi:glycosyltransferase involved in cell wall biosynthesis